MSDAFRVDIPALPGYERAMQAAPKWLDAELLVGARRIAKRAEGIASANVKRDTGNLASTIYSDGKAIPGGVQAIWGASAEYALPVDKGRRPGAKMPPQGALLPYLAAKGIDPSFEYPIRRKIARDGIPAHPFVSKAHKDLLSAGVYLKEFGDAVKRTIAKIAGRG